MLTYDEVKLHKEGHILTSKRFQRYDNMFNKKLDHFVEESPPEH